MYLPSSLNSIGDYSFSGSSSSINITYIGKNEPQICGKEIGLSSINVRNDFVDKDSDGKLCKIAYKKNANSCGNGVYWIFYKSNNQLLIYGNGDVDDYNSVSAPWNSIKNEIFSVNVEKGITAIGNYAFFRCHNLETVSVPDGLTRIGDCCFETNHALVSINIPSSVTTLGSNPFIACEKLTNLTMENNPNYIYYDGCIFTKNFTQLIAYISSNERDSYTVHEKVTTLKQYSIHGVFYLKHLTLNKNLQTIEAGGLYNVYHLENIFVEEGNTKFKSVDGVLFNYDFNTLIKYPCFNSSDVYVVPYDIKTIVSSAFFGVYNLAAVVIPRSFGTSGFISDDAFYYCYNLTSVIYLGYETYPQCTSRAFREINKDVKYHVNGFYKKTAFCEHPIETKQPIDKTHCVDINRICYLFDEVNKLLVFYGSGPMPDYETSDERIWSSYKDKTKKVVIEELITIIKGSNFVKFELLERVYLQLKKIFFFLSFFFKK